MDAYEDPEQDKDTYNSNKRRENLGRVGSIDHVCEGQWMLIVDWLIKVHDEVELIPDILYRTINIFGRFLSSSTKVFSHDELNQLGFTSMVLANKYGGSPSKEEDLVSAYPWPDYLEEIWEKEYLICRQLAFGFTVPSPYHFLFRFIKVALCDEKMKNMVYFYPELGHMLYGVMILRNPSLIAASALYAARCTLKETPLWNETLEQQTEYSESDVRECAKLMVRFHSGAADHDLKTVYEKYSSPNRSSVALCQPATELLED